MKIISKKKLFRRPLRCLNDKHRTILFISDEIERLTGYPRVDFIQNARRSYRSILHPDNPDCLGLTLEESLSRGDTYRQEYRILDNRGRTRWVMDKGIGIPYRISPGLKNHSLSVSASAAVRQSRSRRFLMAIFAILRAADEKRTEKEKAIQRPLLFRKRIGRREETFPVISR